jgi:hypothetical protein
VLLRTNAARRFKKVSNAIAMIWKLLCVAEKRFRRLKGHELLRGVYEGQGYAVLIVAQSAAIRTGERKAA